MHLALLVDLWTCTAFLGIAKSHTSKRPQCVVPVVLLTASFGVSLTATAPRLRHSCGVLFHGALHFIPLYYCVGAGVDIV